MNEEELKASIGEASFNAMTAEQRTSLLGKINKPAKDENKGKKKTEQSGNEGDEEGSGEEGSEDGNEDDSGDLRNKVRKQKETGEQKAREMKGIENALKFNLSVSGFVKDNVDMLPSEIPEILKAADKEKYDTAKERADAVKAAMVQSFFAVQANLDMLTASQKTALDDYLKLTKSGKEQKAESVFENIFEPALETLKKVRKAEELGKARSGFSSGSKVENGYKERLMNASKKTHLGEKSKGE